MQKKIILTTVLMLVVMLMLATGVQANYQSKPTGTRTTTDAPTWIIRIRQMEAENQVMGLNEQIDTTTGLATTDSNNIDVHMEKNTEYGASVLFGASDYGKQGSSIEERRMDTGSTTTSGTDVKATTTGNVYGVYEIGYYNMNTSKIGTPEWAAGGGSSFISTSIAPRYINRYKAGSSNADPKSGDATMETKHWHESKSATWLNYYTYGFRRGGSGAFGFYCFSDSGSNNSYCGRVAVVSGLGF